MKVAILGTGKMGAAMARRLKAQGFEVRVWDRTRAKAEQLGVGHVADTPARAASGVDVAISMVTDPTAVQSIYFDKNGALEASGHPVYIDSSTVSPHTHEELAQAVAKHGSEFLEAPVTGSVAAVESGKLLVMVGGDEAILERVRPVLQSLGDVRHVGPVGDAARLKLIANSMLGIISAAAGELFNGGVKAGVNPERIWEILTRFAPSLEARRAGFTQGKYQPVSFRLADELKDLNLALEVFREAGADTPLTASVQQLYARAARDHGDEDLAAIGASYREGSTASTR